MKVVNKPVEMVVHFIRNKEKVVVKPLRFRITDENGEEKVFKIDRILTQDNERIAGEDFIKFTCQITVNGMEKLCEIRYYKAKMIWILFKI